MNNIFQQILLVLCSQNILFFVFCADSDPKAKSPFEIHLVTYADGLKYRKTQQLLDSSHAAAGFASHQKWTKNDLFSEDFYAQNRLALDSLPFRRGGWWKPFIIWQKLKNVAEGDVLRIFLKILVIWANFGDFGILISTSKFWKSLCHTCYPILGQILENFDFGILFRSQSYNKPPWRNFDFLSNFEFCKNWKFEILNPSSNPNFGSLTLKSNLEFWQICGYLFNLVLPNLE